MAEAPPESTLPSRDLPAHLEAVSEKLYQVMQDVAATTSNRKHAIEASMFSDILGTISHLPTYTWNTFGSAYEGSTIEDLNSDVDSVLLLQELEVIEDRSLAPRGKSLLVIQDELTPAGYAKLQLLSDGEPLSPSDFSHVKNFEFNVYQLSPDKQGRVFVTINLQGVASMLDSKPDRHGPALSLCPKRNELAKDIVFGLSCKSFPRSAEEWLVRERRYDWPPQKVLKECKSMGFILVAIGHPLSDECDLQWRMSLSYQERLLVTQFSEEQLMCFILLKCITKDILNKRMNVESITSYHLKTCMLFMAENTPPELWSPRNLLKCLVLCLEKLESWVSEGVCPNYFVIAENMFDKKVQGDVQRKLKCVMHELLSDDCRFIFEIQISNIGERLTVAMYPDQLRRLPCFYNKYGLQSIAEINMKKFVMEKALYIMDCVRSLLEFHFETQRSAIERLLNKVRELKHTNTITVYTEEQTQRVLSLMLPYLELSLMVGIVALADRGKESKEKIWSLLSSSQWKKVGSDADRYTGKLKQATLLYVTGYYKASLDVLHSIEESEVSIAICECCEGDQDPDYSALFFDVTKGISIEEFMKTFARPCIMFLPTEEDLVPVPLQYEMRRSKYLPGEYRFKTFHLGIDWTVVNTKEQFWYECAVVDAKVLLQLLLYLNNRKLNEDHFAKLHLESMSNVLEIIDKRYHYETALNIAGWMNKDYGNTDRARQYFEDSLKHRCQNNAASWHLHDL